MYFCKMVARHRAVAALLGENFTLHLTDPQRVAAVRHHVNSDIILVNTWSRRVDAPVSG